MQLLCGKVEIFKCENGFVGLCPGLGEKLEREIFVDELHQAVDMKVELESAVLHNGGDIRGWFELHALWHEQIGIGGGCRGNLKRIAPEVTVEILTPASDKHAVGEHAGFVQRQEHGVEQFKFFHEGPSLHL